MSTGSIRDCPGAEPHFRVEDKQNYTLLLKELRMRFDRLEKELHRPLYVTIATGASQEFLTHTEMDKGAEICGYGQPDVL